ncbi:hypothetical protein [Aeromicrobium sp.]|uniref:hypothetical protein n=1 Tax=Aeromicrobium sp. TaxID=1871063 RepID=UPI0028AB550B|nr:hypothetical protein [Aeromicrobium sp.]
MWTNYDAITAYSTLGALGAAVVAAIFAGAAWRSQKEASALAGIQWERELERQHARQASRVWALAREVNGRPEVVVMNQSDGPIFDVHPYLMVDAESHEMRSLGTSFRVIHAGEERTADVSAVELIFATSAAGENAKVEDVIVPVRFLDAGNAPWLRDESGSLQAERA